MTESPNQRRTTPDDLWEVLDAEFEFQVDLAADADNHRCADWYGPGSSICTDSFSPGRWFGTKHRRGFLNPPWSDPEPWLARAYDQAQFHPDNVVVVVLHQSHSGAVAEWRARATEIRNLVGRPMFRVPPGYFQCPKCKEYTYDLKGWKWTPGKERECRNYSTDPGGHGTGVMLKQVKDSSNPRDVQVLVFRRNIHNRLPVIWDWRWREEQT